MGDLTKNISRHELACKCGCGLDTIDHEVVEVVQEACDHFAKELSVDKVVCFITSGARCQEHNDRPASEGGAGSKSKNSWHVKCRAIDFKIKGVSSKDMCMYLCKKYPNKHGIGMYSGRTHIDSDSHRRRWGGAESW